MTPADFAQRCRDAGLQGLAKRMGGAAFSVSYGCGQGVVLTFVAGEGT